MKLSKTLLVIPAASLLFAAAVGSGACSSSVSISTPGDVVVGAPIPNGDVFGGGYAVGGACSGDVYVADQAGNGYLVCDGSGWQYSGSDPASNGYTLDGSGSGVDGGTGNPGVDSGTPGVDSGTPGVDSAAPGVDSAAPTG